MEKDINIKDNVSGNSTSSNTDSDSNLNDTKEIMSLSPIDIKNNSYPYCIVWSPLSFISVLFPFIGHVGICSSKGIIYDYGGMSTDFFFNQPTKYVLIDSSLISTKENWDNIVTNIDFKYNSNNFHLVYDNCHSYCAYVLNQVRYKGRNDYTMFDIFLMVTFKSSFISFMHYIKTYGGFLLLIIMVIYFINFADL